MTEKTLESLIALCEYHLWSDTVNSSTVTFKMYFYIFFWDIIISLKSGFDGIPHLFGISHLMDFSKNDLAGMALARSWLLLLFLFRNDSSKEDVGSHAPRVILFGAIPAIIPVILEVPIVLADPIVTPEVGTVPVLLPTKALDLRFVSSITAMDFTDGSKAFKTLEVLYHCQPLPTDYNRSSLGSLLIEIHTHQRIAEIGAYEGGYYDADVLADVGSYCYGLLRIDDHLETVGASHLVASGRKTSWHMALRMRSFINFVMIRDDTRRRLSALTWWYSHKRTIRTEAEFAMSWRELMKLITKVYCPRNEIQKMESELWNLTVKNNYLAAYTQRFQELTMMCTKMVLEEEDRVEKFIGGLPDNIQGNVIAAETSRLQDVVRIANNLMDQKLNEMLEKCREKNKIGGQSEDNRWTAAHQFKRPNVGVKSGESLKRTATMRENHIIDRCLSATSVSFIMKGLALWDVGSVTRQGHYRSDCPKLKDQNHGNRTGNKNGGGEARGKAYVLGGGDANPDSNVVNDTFLLNNDYASMIFDLGADRSFMSTTFSTLLDITPNTLDVSYAIKLADRRISKTNTVLRGCTLGLLGNPFNIDLMPVELGSFNVIISMDWLANHHAVIVCDEKIV
ncbi:reverse transcriptase domain-containing protein [Tanacetum coccineum]